MIHKRVSSILLNSGIYSYSSHWTLNIWLLNNFLVHDSIFTRLVGDVLLATGFLSYSGPFNQAFRNLLSEKWEKEMAKNRIPFTKDLNVIDMLVDNATVSFQVA